MTDLAHSTPWVWMTADEYVLNSDLIAICEVGDVHEVFTPEGILVRSASASVAKILYYRFESDKAPLIQIVIYDIDPNALTDEKPIVSCSHWNITKGQAFVILEMRGKDKFIPYDRLSFQSIDQGGKVFWPLAPRSIKEISIEEVLAQVNKITLKSKKKS